MCHVLVLGIAVARGRQRVPLLVLTHEIKAQGDDDDDQKAVAAQVRREGDEVARAVPGEEDLGT